MYFFKKDEQNKHDVNRRNFFKIELPKRLKKIKKKIGWLIFLKNQKIFCECKDYCVDVFDDQTSIEQTLKKDCWLNI